jgi:hypothetical protein
MSWSFGHFFLVKDLSCLLPIEIWLLLFLFLSCKTLGKSVVRWILGNTSSWFVVSVCLLFQVSEEQKAYVLMTFNWSLFPLWCMLSVSCSGNLSYPRLEQLNRQLCN